MQAVHATSPLLNQPPRTIEDARLAKVLARLHLLERVRDELKVVADSITREERRFGDKSTRDLARLLDDAWMSLDALITDAAEMERAG
mgnify:CR=1 FL=1